MASLETEITAGKETFPNAKIKKIIDPVLLGEGPHWDQESKQLFFVDLMGKTVHRYNPATKEHKKLELKDVVTFIIPVKKEKNEFVISLGRQLLRLTWAGRAEHTLKSLTTVIPKSGPDICTRLNDAKADHLGNIWLGSMFRESKDEPFEEKQGALYRYDVTGKLDMITECVSISNGIAWNNNRDKMYFIDSPTRRVDVFDYDKETGTAINRRPFFDFAKNHIDGVPDGMTTDCEDNLWIACWDGSRVIRVSSRSGIVLGMLKFPCERITSCVFGGEEMDKLFVTTAKYGLTGKKLKEQPLAGAVFCVEGLGFCGCESHSAIVPPGEELKKCEKEKEVEETKNKKEDDVKKKDESPEKDCTKENLVMKKECKDKAGAETRTN